MAMRIVPMAQEHIEAVAEIESQCFSSPWSVTALEEELNNPRAVFRVAVSEDGRVLGYAGIHHIMDEGYIDNVAVLPDARRQGVARELVRVLENYGRDHTLYRLTLEVRASNKPAIALYESVGYALDGVRPNFYCKPTEDAAIYSLYL